MPERSPLVSRNLKGRLQKLEEHATPLDLTDWPEEEQVEDVLEALHLHRIAGTQQLATDRELRLVDTLVSEGALSESARDFFERMDPGEQPARERWLRANWQAMKERAEYWRHWFSEDQVSARREESERRDRELLASNRGEVVT